MFCGRVQCGRRDQPDDFAFQDRDAVSRGFRFHGGKYPEHRRLFVVRQVHRHLDDPAILEPHTHRLHVPEAAAAVPHGSRDLLRDIKPVGREIDVVGNEWHARADDRGAGAWVGRRRAIVGRPARRGHLRGQPFELAAPDVFQILPRRIAGRLFVEIHRHLKPARHLGGRLFGERNALVHGHAFDRHEGHHVHSAQARMFAGVRAEIDVRDDRLEEGEHRLLDRAGVAGERQHRPVVRRVGRVVQHPDARHLPEPGDGPLHHLRPSPLADVGHAFDNRHGL